MRIALAHWHLFGWHMIACALVPLMWGCASTGLDGGVYRGDGFAFRIPDPPSHWRAVDAEQAALAYRDDPHEGMVLINARCGLESDDVPLQALTQHLFLQFTDRQITSQETVPFDGREAMHTVLDAKLDGVPMRYDVWVLKKDGCVYDLLYLAPPDRFDKGQASFRALVRGFRTVSSDG